MRKFILFLAIVIAGLGVMNLQSKACADETAVNQTCMTVDAQSPVMRTCVLVPLQVTIDVTTNFDAIIQTNDDGSGAFPSEQFAGATAPANHYFADASTCMGDDVGITDFTATSARSPRYPLKYPIVTTITEDISFDSATGTVPAIMDGIYDNRVSAHDWTSNLRCTNSVIETTGSVRYPLKGPIDVRNFSH